MMSDQKRMGKAGLVEGAVNSERDNGLIVALDKIDNLQRYIHVEDFAIAPLLDRIEAAKLLLHVPNDRVVSKRCKKRIPITIIHRSNEARDRLRYFLNLLCI
jgi:hypothetical protein